MQYAYPEYQIDLPEGLMEKCVALAPRLLHEVGMSVANDRFLGQIAGKAGIRIDHQRVYFDTDLCEKHIRQFRDSSAAKFRASKKPEPAGEWTVHTAGYSMMTIDVETEEIREGTCQDLRDMIRLTASFGVGGSYMIMPQDVPPLMRTLACFKICWQMADNVRPWDYQQPQQLPFLYEMHQVMGKPMGIRITIPTGLTIDPKDLDIFMDWYPVWKKGGDFGFSIGNYSMMGILKPITATGCATMIFCESLGTKILFNLFDPQIELIVGMGVAHPTDMRNACWAFGSPRVHLFDYLASRIISNYLGIEPQSYLVDSIRLETSSSAIDTHAGMEKMAFAMLGAMQGARDFEYAGVLCADDLYSGTQFVIDLEIIDFVKQTIESFDPHPDIIDTQGLYEEIVDVALGREIFLSHPNTVRRFRNVLPSPNLIVREKLRTWMAHHKTLKDRARDIAIDRIGNYKHTFSLPDDKHKALDKIYARAQKELS